MPYDSEVLGMYRHWKNNARSLYDLILTHTLEWPSLTVEWLPDLEEPEGGDYSVQKMILGTRAAGREQNYILVAEVELPIGDSEGADHGNEFNPSDGIVRSEFFCAFYVLY